MPHEMFHRPACRIRPSASLRLDDRLCGWELRHPLAATLLAGVIVGGLMLGIAWMVFGGGQ
jgi:hypothetical protein